MNTYQYLNMEWDATSKVVFATILFSTILVVGGYLIDGFTITTKTSFDLPLHVNMVLKERIMNLNTYADEPMQVSDR